MNLQYNVNGANYYLLNTHPPKVSKLDADKAPLTQEEIERLTFLSGNVVVKDPSGKWVCLYKVTKFKLNFCIL